jgi:hypothetical protein
MGGPPGTIAPGVLVDVENCATLSVALAMTDISENKNGSSQSVKLNLTYHAQ